MHTTVTSNCEVFIESLANSVTVPEFPRRCSDIKKKKGGGREGSTRIASGHGHSVDFEQAEGKSDNSQNPFIFMLAFSS